MLRTMAICPYVRAIWMTLLTKSRHCGLNYSRVIGNISMIDMPLPVNVR